MLKLMYNGFVPDVAQCLVFLPLAGNAPPPHTWSAVLFPRPRGNILRILFKFQHWFLTNVSVLLKNYTRWTLFLSPAMPPVSRALLYPAEEAQANWLNNTLWVFVLMSAWFALAMVPYGSIVLAKSSRLCVFQIFEIWISKSAASNQILDRAHFMSLFLSLLRTLSHEMLSNTRVIQWKVQ